MQKVKIRVENNVSSLLQEGNHVVTIKGYKETASKANAGYNDVTEQIAVSLENAAGKFITMWLNTKGYKRFSQLTEKEVASGKFGNSSDDESVDGYAVDKKTGCRIEDEEKTASALSIIGKLAQDAGMAIGLELSLDELMDELVGREVGIAVKGNKVAYTQPAERVHA